MSVTVVNITVLNEEESRKVKSANQLNLLNDFCEWQWKQKMRNEHEHDVAIFLTRYEKERISSREYNGFCMIVRHSRDSVCSSGGDCLSVIGFAPLGTICRDNGKHSCAIVRENGFLTSFTIAHEMGHTYVCNYYFVDFLKIFARRKLTRVLSVFFFFQFECTSRRGTLLSPVRRRHAS